MYINIPTFLTIFRIFLVPLFALFFYLPYRESPLICASIFIIAAITDWFDGYLARRLGQATRFGAFLDPVADKVMVATALVLVSSHYHSWWITLPSAIMICREIVISALREWMAEVGKQKCVAVSWVAKMKTSCQMISLVGLLWHPTPFIEQLGFIAIYVATILTFWSMFRYIWAARNECLPLE